MLSPGVLHGFSRYAGVIVLQRAHRHALLPHGAVASVGGLFYDRDGRPCVSALHQRTLGISHRELAAVPLRVGLAAGAAKAEATRALARGGVLDVLVIDAPLARALLDLTSQG